MSKYVFKRSKPFTFSMSRMTELQSELEAAFRLTGGKTSRVHPEIKEFAAAAWDEMAQRLQFETGRSYDECSREVARRSPWVYLARGEQGNFREYDVDVGEDRA